MNAAPYTHHVSAEVWPATIVLYGAARLPRVAQHQIMVDAYAESKGGDYSATRHVSISAFPRAAGDGWATFEVLPR